MHDLRYALRTLRNRPAFAIGAVLTLVIATGANTAILTVFYRVRLRPLPYREPERLVFVWNAWKNGNHTEVAIPDYLDRRNEAPAIEDAALIAPGTATLSLSGPPEQVGAARVTASFVTTLGRGALVGRVFADRDEHAVVLTHALWQSRFGAEPAAVGRTVRVNAEPHARHPRVLPADFELPMREAELLLPFVFTPQQMPLAAAAAVDAPAIGFTTLTALLMALVFAIVPALAMARRAPSEALKDAGSRSATVGKTGWIRTRWPRRRWPLR